MRPTTVRRMLVFGVCALGVSALYALPGLTQAPHRTAERAGNDRAPDGSDASGRATSPATATPVVRGVDTSGRRDDDGAGRLTGRGQRPTTGATAFTRDVNSPTAITALRTERTRDRLVVRWSAAHDDVAVTSYVVELNGFQVAETSKESVSLRWFKGAGSQQIVQVRALDAAGNVSEPAALLVDRPEPGETPAPDPEPADPTTAPSETPGTDPSPEPSSEPSAEQSAGAGGQAAPQQSVAAEPSAPETSAEPSSDATAQGSGEPTGAAATPGGPSS